MKNYNFDEFKNLIIYDKTHKVLSKNDFKLKKFSTYTKFSLLGTIPFDMYLFINNPSNFIYNIIPLLIKLGVGANSLYNLKNYEFSNYEDYRSSLPTYLNLKKLYNELLCDILNEIDLSKFDKDLLTLTILLSEVLIPNGLISITQKFHRINNNDVYVNCDDYFSKSILDLLGIYVISGYGCCRHFNSFIGDIFNIKGVKIDKVACINTDLQNYCKRKLDFNYIPNHLINGLIIDNNYYFIDGYNTLYSIKHNEEYFYQNERIYIPNFDINYFQEYINWNPNFNYQYFDDKEIKLKREKIYNTMNDEFDRFMQFKDDNYERLFLIHLLSLLEFERTPEKEKVKKYNKN